MGNQTGTLSNGAVLGRYRIAQRIGRGAMGEIYRAADVELERPVAIKVLSTEVPGLLADREQLLREARLACSITHPNIVTIYSIERAEGMEFIVMEWVDGETLQNLLRDGPLEPDQLLEIGADIAEALAATHEVGLLHRDIKPANIMITPRGKAKVLDFGLAKRLTFAADGTVPTAAYEATAADVIKGTIPYMSPEQTRAEPLDARSDLFSLGSVLYRCATGELPFPGSDALAVIRAINAVDPVPPSRIRPDLHPAFDLVLARVMAKDRAGRFATGVELAQALRSLRAGTVGSVGRVLRETSVEATHPNNLPPQPTSFIGRDREIAQVKRLLGSSRLVTLTGTGGCGKTRLALRVARDVLQECPDGAWFVDLAPLADPSLVPQAVASVLSVRETPGQSLLETLADWLIGKALFLVLDNCEHLVAACAALAGSLLHACPTLHVLVTSREPLRIPGEVVWRTPSMRVPSDTETQDQTWERLKEFESVQLFVERAQATHSPFNLGKQNAAIVAQICRRLDGIPLAIELAAARAGALAPREILSRLEDRFRLLARESHGVIHRQQTLRATIDWSHELLPEEERVLFRRLGIFAGSFRLDAAETVSSGAERDPDTVHRIAQLFEKSLLMAEEESGGGGRYRLPETLRAYARERLRAAGEEPSLAERHRDYFLSVVEEAETELQGPDQADWLHRLDADHEDIRIAIRQLLDQGNGRTAARFCGALWRFWWVRGMWTEGRTKLREALASNDHPTSGAEVLKMLHGSAVLARGQGAYDEAEALLQRGLGLARSSGDSRATASMLHELGNIANERGDLSKARSLYDESLGLWRRLDDRRGMSSVLHNLGVVAQSQRDYKAARGLYEESLSIQRDLGNRAWEASGLNGLGSVALAQSDWPMARSCHEHALEIQRELGDQWGMGFSLRELGVVAERTGDLPGARQRLKESLRILRDIGDREGIAESLESLVGLAVSQGQPERALRLAGAAWALRESLGSPLMPADRQRLDARLREAKQGLGKDAASQAYAEGRAFPLDRAVRYGLEEPSEGALSPVN